MKAGHKFILGASLIVASVGFLIAEGGKETGVYFLTPALGGIITMWPGRGTTSSAPRRAEAAYGVTLVGAGSE